MFLQLAVMIAVIAIGSRKGGVAMGLWGAVGVFVLATVFRVAPADTGGIVDVILIILAVIMAASAMEAAGGIEYLVSVAERIIRRHPSRVTLIAPVVSWAFTVGAGTAHVFYPLLPVIHDVSRQGGIRPERPLAVSSIAATVGITASPVSAAMAAMIVLFEGDGWSLPKIMAVSVPATLLGVLVAALVQSRIGKPLDRDPEYRRRLAAGEIEEVAVAGSGGAQGAGRTLPEGARRSAYLFMAGTFAVVVTGLFPVLRPVADDGSPIAMASMVEILMLGAGALILMLCRVDAAKVPRTEAARSGLVAVIGVFGLSWLGLTFIGAHQERITGALGSVAEAHPWFFAVMLLLLSALLFSQATTTKALMPLGIALGIPAPLLIAMWPAVNGYFLLPAYGTFIAAMNFDRSGTTRIGRFVLNHSFMIPGLVATATAVGSGFALVGLVS
ncbi:anaerobic C4-dicarboxylate transporter family protein [Streptomyces sp. NPDC004111]|uniref:anaerobic C4-dicarboxylate transporter family protein n=1 Tax=Streptomyces sp. NPDC004111 TaxID=3364690 RepID=UPI003678BE92